VISISIRFPANDSNEKNHSAIATDFIIYSLFGCEFTHFWECGERLNLIAFPIIIVEKIS